MRLMRTVKNTIAMTAIAGLLLSAAGCGQSAGDEASEPATKSMTMWTWDKAQLEPLAKEYEAKTGVHVNLIDRGVGETEYSQFAAAKKNTPPDIVQLEYPVIGQYAREGFIEPDLWKDVDSSSFVSPAWAQSTVDSHVYGLPLDYGGLTFYYNEDLLMSDGVETPPTTWDQFCEVAKAVKSRGHYLAALPADSSLIEAIAAQAGAKPYVTTSTQTTVTLTTDNGVKTAVNWLQKMTTDQLFPVDVEPWSDEWLQAMRSEQIVGVIAGTDKASLIADKLPSLAGKMVVGPAVALTVGGQNAEYGGSALAVTSASQSKKEAAAFVRWLATDSDAIQSRVDNGAYPATEATQSLATFTELNSLPSEDGSKKIKYYQDAWNKQSNSNNSRVPASPFEWFPFEQDARDAWSKTTETAREGREAYESKIQAWQSRVVQSGVDNDLVMRTPGDVKDDANGVDAGKVKKSSKANTGDDEGKQQNPNAVNKN